MVLVFLSAHLLSMLLLTVALFSLSVLLFWIRPQIFGLASPLKKRLIVGSGVDGAQSRRRLLQTNSVLPTFRRRSAASALQMQRSLNVTKMGSSLVSKEWRRASRVEYYYYLLNSMHA